MPPIFLAFFAIFCYAIMTVLNRKYAISDISPFVFMGISMTTLAVLSFFFLGAQIKPSLSQLSLANWGYIIGFGALNFVGFYTLLKALQSFSASEYQIIALSSPIFVILIASVVLKEPILLKHFVGAACVALGIYIAIK